jgi:hypothetical protein
MIIYFPLLAVEHLGFLFLLLLIACVPSFLFQFKDEEDRIRHIYKVMVLGTL